MEEITLEEPPLKRKTEIALGIAIEHATTAKGQRRTLAEIAAYANCSAEAISKIERRTLQKVREALANDREVRAYFGTNWIAKYHIDENT